MELDMSGKTSWGQTWEMALGMGFYVSSKNKRFGAMVSYDGRIDILDPELSFTSTQLNELGQILKEMVGYYRRVLVEVTKVAVPLANVMLRPTASKCNNIIDYLFSDAYKAAQAKVVSGIISALDLKPDNKRFFRGDYTNGDEDQLEGALYPLLNGITQRAAIRLAPYKAVYDENGRPRLGRKETAICRRK